MELLSLALVIIIAVCFLGYKNEQYKKTSYYQITKNSYLSTKYNKGKYGEYLIYKNLRHFENEGGKFLFNIYIPKANNQTTEIDVILVCSKGLFVFESKNYSGWIFGDEKQTYWMQTFPLGYGRSHKQRFYNPIIQNALHIKYLRHLIDEKTPIHSVIVFSDICTLKRITVESPHVSVIKRRNVGLAITWIGDKTQTDVLSELEISNIYNKLYTYTQVSDELRERHVANIQNIKAE